MFSCEFCGIFKNTFVIKLFQATLQVHKVDKNVSRYYNKDIKVIPVEPILVTLCQLWKWFSMLRKLWKPTSRKTYQNLRYLQGKYLWWSFLIVKPYLLIIIIFLFWRFTITLLMTLKLIILWNFILKLYLRSWFLSLPFVDRLSWTLKC